MEGLVSHSCRKQCVVGVEGLVSHSCRKQCVVGVEGLVSHSCRKQCVVGGWKDLLATPVENSVWRGGGRTC